MELMKIIDAAVSAMEAVKANKPKVALILGSGLGDYADGLSDRKFVTYADIPGFPVSSVEGHAGQFVLGDHKGVPVVAMQGRFHYYEGFSQSLLTVGVRAMRKLGAEILIVTNAAGGVNLSYSPGTLMLIEDHINFSGSHPLIGENLNEFGPRFPDQSNVYDRDLRQKVLDVCGEEGYPLEQGVYMMFSGPTYETPAEIRMARAMGADAVGMSTVPEAIAAAHCGMKTIGISLITNMAAGILPEPLSHGEVQKAAAAAAARFTSVMDVILERVV